MFFILFIEKRNGIAQVRRVKNTL